ncbi:carbon-nitrogen hydrolase family protein [Paroceanicella profunda]|uniref:Carbon-nitrogen hydrolase family protein n=1 Tax=Paroceanicella profunda TaxID=2579971 RepID=A0A5B8FXS5_9RHOB|nr:carbon-nitrogen hydrolase family protein [Paroceanicella profunda]QDL93315.1 carbon-nitrogen hydrolase family protein [Paroceanicella profunda]
MAKIKVAVVQAGTEGADTEATLAKAEALIAECGRKGVQVAVFPEAFVGGYPKGADFHICVGMRRPATREEFLAYASRAIPVPGAETERLSAAVREAGLHLTIGVIERAGGTLYCTALFFGPDGTLLGKHRKTLPTAAERLVWGHGDGSTLTAVDTPWGPMGAVICWENYVPLLRMAMYSKGLTLYCAPTADDRDTWAPSMQHVALEGRCFVLSACQYLKRSQFPEDMRNSITDTSEDVLMRGGSMIVGPLGNIIAGPDFSGEAIITAEIDMEDITRAQFDHDVNGHYARPDLFKLIVNEQPRRSVVAVHDVVEA